MASTMSVSVTSALLLFAAEDDGVRGVVGAAGVPGDSGTPAPPLVTAL